MNPPARVVKTDVTPVGVHLTPHSGGLHNLDSGRRAKIESQEDHVHAVRSDVAQSSTAEIEPATPSEGVVHAGPGSELPLPLGTVDRVSFRQLVQERPCAGRA